MKPSELVKELKSHAGDLVDTESYTKRLLTEAADLIEGLIPRPIEEAPKDGTWFAGISDVIDPVIIISFQDRILHDAYRKIYDPLFIPHFVPLSSIQKLMESGE